MRLPGFGKGKPFVPTLVNNVPGLQDFTDSEGNRLGKLDAQGRRISGSKARSEEIASKNQGSSRRADFVRRPRRSARIPGGGLGESDKLG